MLVGARVPVAAVEAQPGAGRQHDREQHERAAHGAGEARPPRPACAAGDDVNLGGQTPSVADTAGAVNRPPPFPPPSASRQVPAGSFQAVMSAPAAPPGTQQPRRYRPTFHYELVVCGLRGHELVGTDAAELRAADAPVIRDAGGGLRWVRCLRCDSWLALPAPASPERRFPPAREEIALPLRGRALRDKVVLRLIAVDRALHFVILGVIAVALFIFAANQTTLSRHGYQVLTDLQGGFGGPVHDTGHGFIHELRHLLSIHQGTLLKIGLLVSAYALLEGVEAVGLWWQKRWAEYLTLIATASLLPLGVYELAHRFSPLKVLTFVLNVAVVVYLLFAKRLFGLRGGAAAERAERERDSGWPAIDRATPPAATVASG
jgi:uncharacterized membrane protein (DUF2068 family)